MKLFCILIVVLVTRINKCVKIHTTVHPKIFTGRTDAEGETSILWPPDVQNRLIGKDPEVGKDG